MDEDIKLEIDQLSYEDMVRKIRFSPVGDFMFVGEASDYLFTRYKKLRSELSQEEKTGVSKSIGWDK